MYELAYVSSIEDIHGEIKDTLIGLLLEYHNLNRAKEDVRSSKRVVSSICKTFLPSIEKSAIRNCQ
jgi:hypothetical protein